MGNTCRVGNIRPSQLLWTYGPGAMIDLPNFSVMTMGLDSWKQDQCHLIEEPRLLEQVRKMCGAQVERMLQPPVCETELDNPNDPHSYIGVPVQPFPRWFRCVKCGMMAEYDSGLFCRCVSLWRASMGTWTISRGDGLCTMGRQNARGRSISMKRARLSRRKTCGSNARAAASASRWRRHLDRSGKRRYRHVADITRTLDTMPIVSRNAKKNSGPSCWVRQTAGSPSLSRFSRFQRAITNLRSLWRTTGPR